MVDLSREAELREAIELFYFAYRAFTNEPDLLLAERGLGRVHHRIIYFVGRHPGIVVNELLAILAVTKQALNGPLGELIALGLVETQTARHDRRFKRLRLTPAGLELEAALTNTQLGHFARVFAAAGPDAERAWKSVMRGYLADVGVGSDGSD